MCYYAITRVFNLGIFYQRNLPSPLNLGLKRFQIRLPIRLDIQFKAHPTLCFPGGDYVVFSVEQMHDIGLKYCSTFHP